MLSSRTNASDVEAVKKPRKESRGVKDKAWEYKGVALPAGTKLGVVERGKSIADGQVRRRELGVRRGAGCQKMKFRTKPN